MTNPWRILLAAALALPTATSHAQTPTPSASPAKAKPDAPKGPTIITATDGTTFDQKANIATFTGTVKVVDPQFTLDCDKLTVYMRTDNKPVAGKGKGKAAPTPTPKPTPATKGSKVDEGPQEGGGIDHAIAEGNVHIRQEKPGENGGPPQVNIGKCQRANFNNRTGEVVMYGSPQLQQGISTHIAMSEETVMHLDNAGHLKTDGPSRTVIQDAPDASPSPKPLASPSATGASLLPVGRF